MLRAHRFAAFLLIGTLASAPDAAAQSVAHTFSELQNRLKSGDAVYVTDQSHFEVKGVVETLSTTSLSLVLTDGNRRSFDESEVREVARDRHPAAKGFAIGAGVGLGALLLFWPHDCGRCASGPGAGAAVFVGVSSLIGGMLAHTVSSRTVIYRL